MMRTVIAVAAFVLSVAAVGAAAPASAAEPNAGSPPDALIVVLDISDSMKEDDGSGKDGAPGKNKLIAAKTAVERILRTQGEAATVGVWTYPGGASADCSAGGFTVNPERFEGNDEGLDIAVSKVDELAANGNTPTGEALTAAVENLKGRGITAATIVLVSDGESNCETPPCDVAAQFAGSGFDITVDAVGFQQSDQGREELECIASATGGRYFDADDAEQLTDRLDELTKPSITVELTYAERVSSGATMTITATISNPSSRDAAEVKANLAFSAPEAHAVLPAVIPPTYSIGGIPAGGQVTRQWQVSTGTLGEAATGTFAVTTWGSNVSARRTPGAFTVDAEPPGVESLGEIFGQIHDGHQLLILGDSFSSGEGTFEYLPNYAGREDKCHRSLKTYAATMYKDEAADKVRIVACSGAVTSNLYLAQHADAPSSSSKGQLFEIQTIHGPGAALMTFGGNDIGFGPIIEACISVGSCADYMAVQPGALVAGLTPTLTSTYERVWEAVNDSRDLQARNGKYAPVVVLAYPQIFHESASGSCFLFEETEIDFANDLVKALNAAVKKAVDDARDHGYEVYFVPDTQAAFLPDRTYCDGDDANVNLVSALNRQESVHPNIAGYAAETAVLQRWSTTVERVAPDIGKIENARSYNLAQELSEFWAGQVADLQAKNNPALMSGGPVNIKDTGHEPFDTTVFMLRSTPVTIGSLTADENGVVDGRLIIPEFIPPGQHSLVGYGHDAEGNPMTVEMAVTVVDSPPFWLLLVAGLSLMVLAGAVALLIVGLVRTRRRKVQAPETTSSAQGADSVEAPTVDETSASSA